MMNFLYTFGGVDKKQRDGGPIRDVLTQAISRHFGNEFGELFNQKIVQLDVKKEI